MNADAPVQWVFRHAGGALIDTPDLATPPAMSTWHRWAATLWPDPTEPDQWAALMWMPAPRGWWFPRTLAIGDIVDFGITWTDRRHQSCDRWFGWLERATPLALIVNGPYPHPELALLDARPRIDELGLAQLDPPAGIDELVAATDQRDD